MESHNLKPICPFDPNHVLDENRLLQHIVKCRKVHPEIKMVRCPFTIKHMVSPANLDDHVRDCPDRRIFDDMKYKFDNQREVPGARSVPPIDEGENWDTEPHHSSYKPWEYASNANVLRTMQNATKSEKRAFRNAEHKRLSQLNK